MQKPQNSIQEELSLENIESDSLLSKLIHLSNQRGQMYALAKGIPLDLDEQIASAENELAKRLFFNKSFAPKVATEDWEKEFDNEFLLLKTTISMESAMKGGPTEPAKIICANPSKIKSFIRQLLASQKAQIREKGEKMKKVVNYILYTETNTVEYLAYNNGYNQALEDLLKEL